MLPEWMNIVDRKELPGQLREGEDAILGQIQGDIVALQTCLRLMCRFVSRHLAIPKFADMPPEVQGAGNGGLSPRTKRLAATSSPCGGMRWA